MPTHNDPERDQFDAFKALPCDQPIEMINLIAFREHADYPHDHPCAQQGLSGAQAYAMAATAGPSSSVWGARSLGRENPPWY